MRGKEEIPCPELYIICWEWEIQAQGKTLMIHMLLWEFGELRVQRHINYMIHERLWSGSEHKVTHVLATSCPIYNLCRYCKCPILGMCNIPRYSPLLQVTQSTLDLSFQHQKMVLLNPARHYSVSWYVVRGQLFSSLSLPPAWYLVDIETVGAASIHCQF